MNILMHLVCGPMVLKQTAVVELIPYCVFGISGDGFTANGMAWKMFPLASVIFFIDPVPHLFDPTELGVVQAREGSAYKFEDGEN